MIIHQLELHLSKALCFLNILFNWVRKLFVMQLYVYFLCLTILSFFCSRKTKTEFTIKQLLTNALFNTYSKVLQILLGVLEIFIYYKHKSGFLTFLDDK